MRLSGAIMGLVAAALMAGCGGRAETPAADAAPVDDGLRPVLSITDIDVGRTFEGVLVTVRGEAETAGWSSARLRPRGVDSGADGAILAFDLVARPPESPPTGALAGLPAARRVEAALPLSVQALAGVSALRVHGVSTAATVNFR